MLSKWFSSFSNKVENSPLQYNQICSSADVEFLTKNWQSEKKEIKPTIEERKLLVTIREETIRHNRNNITRTNAYLDFFKEHEEVHWAFLAHMVSRNGGWNMTDLKASHISSLLSYETTAILFRFLEKANYLIFKDAFPQLLIWKESKKREKSLFHLLPLLKVSTFMEPVWNQFFQTSNKELLTVALIINEQSLIEENLLRNPFYQQKVLSNFTFQLQEKLGFTLVLFPYHKGSSVFLTGLIVDQFSSLITRIDVGKKLYCLLFKKFVKKGAIQFCDGSIHTGSRSDYYPEIFSIHKNSHKIFSPPLQIVWQDVHHPSSTPKDWFTHPDHIISLLSLPQKAEVIEMDNVHKKNLIKLSGMTELHGIFSTQ
ncbi:DUF2515 family protein [Sutcliffiella rhizosphaerae]|uniref:DUF2515 domain-containing protein n=1 Tax=Sutcliffiella rhizosphaerae TaxID=2880967 RepID=A0ABM8YQ54_9BACI|nr:DUF2515 family protein [Sutcliffiella rhizosphaerae]CAG9621955.1 hypothetical protein BACCIP111883_02746 [Sutcliffiella rhizosphaerae]